MTARLGTLLGLDSQSRVLDVASGRGDNAIFLAQKFGCKVVGIDYSARSVIDAGDAAERAGESDRVRFEQADAEALPFEDETFDALVCECAFCTFPAKDAAAAEFARVLRSGGRVGLSDLTRNSELLPELDTLLGWIACLADAQPVESYVEYLHSARLKVEQVELHNDALATLMEQVRAKLLGAELLAKFGKLDLPLTDFGQAQAIARAAQNSVREGKLGYAVIVANKPGGITAHAT